MILVFLTACEGNLDKAQLEEDKAVSIAEINTSLTEKEYLQQAKYFQQALEDTPYVALIKITSVETIELPDPDTSDDYAEQKSIYHARVLETYRGSKSSHISYVMYTEIGDEVEHPKDTFIITLCQSKEGLYWPGVGASFSADKRLIELAKTHSKQLNENQVSFSACDD